MNQPSTQPRPAATRLAPLRHLLAFARRYRGHVIGAAGALVLAAGSTLLIGQGLRLLVDRGFLGDDPAQLDRLLLATLLIILVMATASAVRFYLVSWIGERVAADLRQAVFDHVLRHEPAFFEQNGVAEIQSRLTTDTSVLQALMGSSLSIALRNALLLVGALAMLLVTSPRLTGLVVVALPAVLIPVLILGRRVRRLSRASQDRIADVSSDAAETLQGIQTVQAFGQEDRARRRFREHVDQAFVTGMDRTRQRAWLVGAALTLAFTAVGAVLWQGGHDVLAGRMTPGELSAFVFYAVLAAGATAAISEVSGDLFRAAGAMERLLELLRAEPRVQPPARPQWLPATPEGRVAFSEVTFAYPARPETPVLTDVNFTLEPGERVALVGPSGAGKSTLFSLLLRFHDPDQGCVTFDGFDLRDLDPRDLRRRIGLVAQEPILFTGSARENIRFGDPDADEACVDAAAAAAQCTPFLEALPQGADTPLGPGGVQLSGGQRQRIAIARAILRDPALLLLDEATSSLDADSEARVQAALDRLLRDRTSLVIAHRLATVRSADRIIVLDQGRVQAQGTHSTLLRDSPLYAHLAALQFRSDGLDTPAAADAPMTS
ncbi:MAG: ABC transporter transmembrane domain-containing protein [Ectothiorhodospiraceae bacterium]